MKITNVVHCKKQKFDVYIGRPSKWGNPFKMKSENERAEVIEKYRKWITAGSGQYLLNDLHELKDKVLACWCYPKKCHGDILIELLNTSKNESADKK